MKKSLIYAATLLASVHAGGSRAQPTTGPIESALKSFVSQQVTALHGSSITRFEVTVGNLEVLATYPACSRAEPVALPGSRYWGKSSVGLRCSAGAEWLATLPVVVLVWGPALVAKRSMPAGTVLEQQDLNVQDAELTREMAGGLKDLQSALGRTLLRPVQEGQVIRPDLMRATYVIQAGDQVKLRIAGVGFQVAASGFALNNAASGQSVRVRTDLGKSLTGLAREGRLVDVGM